MLQAAGIAKPSIGSYAFSPCTLVSLLLNPRERLRSQFFALPLSTTLTIRGSYAFGYPLQLFWFSKIAKGLIKVLSAGGGKKGKKAS